MYMFAVRELGWICVKPQKNNINPSLRLLLRFMGCHWFSDQKNYWPKGRTEKGPSQINFKLYITLFAPTINWIWSLYLSTF